VTIPEFRASYWMIALLPTRERIVARSSSSTASSGPAVQLVHKATVNGRLVPLCDEVMVVSPDADERGPTAVIPHWLRVGRKWS
jgi:hypothetical protein